MEEIRCFKQNHLLGYDAMEFMSLWIQHFWYFQSLQYDNMFVGKREKWVIMWQMICDIIISQV